MTKKRFKHHMGLICEKRDGEYYSFTVKEVCDLLNALNDENEQLKEDNMLLIDDSEKYRKLSIQFDNRNKELIRENELLRKDLIGHSALISMLEDYQALHIEETLWNLTGVKSEEEFNELYKPYLDKAKECWND